MEDLFAGFTDEWQWTTIRTTHDLCSSDEEEVEPKTTRNSSNKKKLSRTDIMSFGLTPTECKMYLECDDCHEILNPRRLLVHKRTLCKSRREPSREQSHVEVPCASPMPAPTPATNKTRKSNKSWDPAYIGISNRSAVGVPHKSQTKKQSLARQQQQQKERELKPPPLLKASIAPPSKSTSEEPSYMPIVRRIVNAVETSTTTITYVPIKLKTESDSTRHTTSINTSVPTTDRSINGALNTDEKCFITRDTSQDSPISVGKSISIVTIQSQSVFIPIPEPDTSDMKMYKTNPKPVAVPNFGLKKIDRAIILRLARQKSDILKALDTIRNTNNSNNNNNQAVDKQPQPNVLKITNSVNCKRSAPDLISPSDNSKQRRLVENGFIFHAEKAATVICPNT